MKTALLWFAMSGCLLGSSPGAQEGTPKQDPEAAMAEQISLLAENLTRTEVRAALGEESIRVMELDLERASLLLEEGHWLAGLRPLVQTKLYMDQSAFDVSGSSTQDLAALVAECAEFLGEVRALPSPLEGRHGRPAELQALLEENRGRAEVYAVAAPEQGREVVLAAGIYYLAQGRAHGAAARWLMSLAPPKPAHPVLGFPGLDAYFDRLERELLEVYRPPLSKTLHSAFIQISAGLKFGRELKARGFVFGALHEALEVAHGLEQISLGSQGEPSPRLDELSESLIRMQARWKQLPSDTSMADPYALLAQHLLDTEDLDLVPARSLVERVLVDYLACIEPGAALAMEAASTEEPEVIITLVRWPFT